MHGLRSPLLYVLTISVLVGSYHAAADRGLVPIFSLFQEIGNNVSADLATQLGAGLRGHGRLPPGLQRKACHADATAALTELHMHAIDGLLQAPFQLTSFALSLLLVFRCGGWVLCRRGWLLMLPALPHHRCCRCCAATAPAAASSPLKSKLTTTLLPHAPGRLTGWCRRTNASYSRWLDARKTWGLLINRSRDLVRQVVMGCDGPQLLLC